MIVGRNLAEPVRLEDRAERCRSHPTSSRNKDGSKNWKFDLVGIYDGKDADWQHNTQFVDPLRLFRRGQPVRATASSARYTIKIADDGQAEMVAQTIDAMFENSPDETKTQTEKDFIWASPSRSATSA